MSGILILESLTRGNTLKQGDKTPLKYRLFDADGEKLNIAGKSAKVRLVYPDFLTIGYEKDGLTVAQDDTVTFTIDQVIPSRIYHVEIIVDDQFIFPSRADESKFTVDKSSFGTETNIIEIVGKDILIREVKSRVDTELEPLVTSLESAQQAELEREQAENERNNNFESYAQEFENVINTSERIVEETNILKKYETIDGERTISGGTIMPDEARFRSELIPVVEGERFANVSGNQGLSPTFVFYKGNAITSGNFVSQTAGKEVIVPVGATHMLFWHALSVKNTLIIKKMASGFPTLGENTFDYKDVYTKDEVYNRVEVDSKLSIQPDVYTKDETYNRTEIDSKLLTQPDGLQGLEAKVNNNTNRINSIGIETNIMLTSGVVEGSRTDASGNIYADSGFFRTEPVPVESGERYATVAVSTASFPNFSFYSSGEIKASNLVIKVTSRDAIVPANATFMIVNAPNALRDSFVIRKMEEGFPVLGESTIEYSNLYTKEEIDKTNDELNIKMNQIVTQSNLMDNAKIIEKTRIDASGNLYADDSYFLVDVMPITVGDRYATVSENTSKFPVFGFYSTPEIKSTNLLSRISARSATAPIGATHMIVFVPNDQRASFVLSKMADGFPTLGESTLEFPHLYTKEEVDEKIGGIKGVEWLPSVWELEIIDDERPHRVVHIDKDDVLYLSDSFNGIYKANNVDLNDIRLVATLPSNSVLTKFILVSDEKGVGYVQNPPNPEHAGFYVFENTHTDNWTYRKTGKMLMGHPPLEFQGLVKTPDSQYLFAISYSSASQKITDPSDTTTEAPRHVYRSTDLGETWQVVYTHLTRFNTHMHAVEWDTYRNRLWVAIGDEGAGGRPGWVWSDDYGETFDFVENNDATGQIPFMDTNIIPTRKYVLFGSDHHPAGIRKWEPKVDEKHAHATNDDVTTLFPIPYQTTNNFGFARNPVVDVSTYPYKIGMSFTHNADYSGSVVLLSPNFQDWFQFDYVADPRVTPSWNAFSGMTSDGWVLGWSSLTSDGKKYYRRFKFPDWLDN